MQMVKLNIQKVNIISLMVKDLDFKLDEKLGAIDFETYGENGYGNQSVYAGGWGTKDFNNLCYINENESSEDVVKRVLESIFEHKELDGYTFFAHNLGRFDSIFLIKGAARMDHYTIKALWKEDKVLSVTIKNNESKRRIKILDSMQFVNGSLRDILVSFNCTIKKGFFPYSYVNKDNLYYIGNKPDIKYFENITLDAYEQLPENINLIIKEMEDYNNKSVVSDTGKLAKINNDKIENLFLIIETYAAKRKAQISASELDKLLTVIKGILDVNISELTGKVESIISSIEDNC